MSDETMGDLGYHGPTIQELEQTQDLLTIRYVIAEAVLIIVGIVFCLALWRDNFLYISGGVCLWMALRMYRLERSQYRLEKEIADMEAGREREPRRRFWWW